MQPYFTINELSSRWGLSVDAIGGLGADGYIRFGVYITGLLLVEIGTYGPGPDYKFIVEDAAQWSGFVPVTPRTVARAWTNRKTERLEIPDTNCGKVVRVVSLITSEENDEGPLLLVAADDVEKFERQREVDKPTTVIVPMKEPKQKDDWFYAIKSCVIQFENENNRTPTETQLWIRLYTAPPSNYGITIGKNKGTVSSTGRRNASLQFIRRRTESQSLPWSLIQS